VAREFGFFFHFAMMSPYSQDPLLSGNDPILKKDERYKKIIRVLRFLARFVSLLLSGFIIASLAHALAQFYLTQGHKISGGASPWPKHPTLWSTYMLLAIAAITFIMNFIVICTYICGVNAANKASSITGYIGYALLAVRIVAWGVAAGLFQKANTGNDLWGYSCSDQADAIQAQVQSYINFNTLCLTQTGAWYSSIIEVALYVLDIAIIIAMLKRRQYKRKVGTEAYSMYEPEGRKGYAPVMTNA